MHLVTDHEFTRVGQQGVDLVVALANGAFVRIGKLCLEGLRAHYHTLVESLVESVLVANQLRQGLDFVDFFLIFSHHA